VRIACLDTRKIKYWNEECQKNMEAAKMYVDDIAEKTIKQIKGKDQILAVEIREKYHDQALAKMKEETKKAEKAKEEAKRAQEEAKISQQKAQQTQQKAVSSARSAVKKANDHVQTKTKELSQEKQKRLNQLTREKTNLMNQLHEKEEERDTESDRVATMSKQIAMEEKEIESFRVESDDSTKLIITLGMTGAGKSTLCNRLEGDESKRGNKGGCPTSNKSHSCTQSHSKIVVQSDEHRVMVVDTPGFGDSGGEEKDREHSNRLCAYLKKCGGINSFVLVRNGTNVRFDQAFQDMLKQYHEMFGQKFFERLIVVATRIEHDAKEQYEEDNGESMMRGDICELAGKLCNLDDLQIPVIPIGTVGYKESIQNLLNAVHSDRHVIDSIKSPIDELRAQHDAALLKQKGIETEIKEINSQIAKVNTDIEDVKKPDKSLFSGISSFFGGMGWGKK